MMWGMSEKLGGDEIRGAVECIPVATSGDSGVKHVLDENEPHERADTEKFPELTGWYYHPIDGWVQDEQSTGLDEISNERITTNAQTPAEEAYKVLGLIDEKAWHAQNGTLDNEELYNKFEYNVLCNERLRALSQEAQEELTAQLLQLCTPGSDSDAVIRTTRVMDELLHYMRYLAEMGDAASYSILYQALSVVAESKSVSYVYAQRAANILRESDTWRDSSEFRKRQKILESWQARQLVTLAPGIPAYFTDQEIYIPGDRQHPNVLNHRLGYDDLYIALEPDMYERANAVWQDYYFLRKPETFHVLPKHIQRCMYHIALPEQAQVIQFMQQRTVEEFSEFSSFVERFGVQGARTFLALETNDRLGEEILRMAHDAPESLAETIFETFGEMVDEIQSIEAHLCGHYGCEQGTRAHTIRSIAKDVLHDASLLLEEYAHKIEQTPRRARHALFQRLQPQLETFRANAHLTAISFKRMQEQYPDLALEELAGVSVKTLAGSELTEQVKEQMRAIYLENYASYPEAFRDALQHKFADRQSPDTRFHVVTDDEENVLSFMSFSDQDDGSVYFGSNNTNPWLKGKRIGGALMYAAVPQEGKDRVVHAHCVPHEPITQTYLNRLGFVGTGVVEMGGVTLLTIQRDGTEKGVYASKFTSEDDIVAHVLPENAYVVEQALSTPFAHVPKEDGDVLTRLLVRDDTRYLVYERPSPSDVD